MPVEPIMAPEHNPRDNKPSEFSSWYDVAVARKVPAKEVEVNPKCIEAMGKEWTRLRSVPVWLDDTVIELDDLKAKTKNGSTIHIGGVWAFCVEKGAELQDNDPLKKMKGRAVFLGDQVKTQTGDFALFQDLGSSPSTFECSKICDFYAMQPGNSGQQADAIQAYTQAKLKGTETWVTLP